MSPEAARAGRSTSAVATPDDQLTALSSSGDPFAVGGGTTAGFLGGPGTQFALSAHLGPNGPSGYAVVSIPSGTIQGHVICYQPQSTNQGNFAFMVEKATGVFARFVGETAVYTVRDSGQPSSAPSGDVITPSGTCSFLSSFEPSGGLVLQGNIVVRN